MSGPSLEEELAAVTPHAPSTMYRDKNGRLVSVARQGAVYVVYFETAKLSRVSRVCRTERELQRYIKRNRLQVFQPIIQTRKATP